MLLKGAVNLSLVGLILGAEPTQMGQTSLNSDWYGGSCVIRNSSKADFILVQC